MLSSIRVWRPMAASIRPRSWSVRSLPCSSKVSETPISTLTGVRISWAAVAIARRSSSASSPLRDCR